MPAPGEMSQRHEQAESLCTSHAYSILLANVQSLDSKLDDLDARVKLQSPNSQSPRFHQDMAEPSHAGPRHQASQVFLGSMHGQDYEVGKVKAWGHVSLLHTQTGTTDHQIASFLTFLGSLPQS